MVVVAELQAEIQVREDAGINMILSSVWYSISSVWYSICAVQY